MDFCSVIYILISLHLRLRILGSVLVPACLEQDPSAERLCKTFVFTRDAISGLTDHSTTRMSNLAGRAPPYVLLPA